VLAENPGITLVSGRAPKSCSGKGTVCESIKNEIKSSPTARRRLHFTRSGNQFSLTMHL
jgi:hypothetical protein